MAKKDMDSSELLRKALQRGDILSKQLENGAIDLKTQTLLVESIMDGNPENVILRN